MGCSALLLARHPDIGAILCGSDQVVRGVLDTARDLGRSAPDDIAVIGCGHPRDETHTMAAPTAQTYFSR